MLKGLIPAILMGVFISLWATLLITTKDFHNDSNGNVSAARLKISSLCNAYEAYKVLNELTEVNNENLMVKIEK